MTMQTRTLALAGAILLLSACGNGEEAGPGGAAGQMPPPQVGVVVARQTTVPLTQEMVGRLAPYRSADVRARVPGVLQKRVYEEGSDVSEGDVLFLIDPAPLRAALGQAQASLAQAQASYANAKANADRARQLLPQKFISKSDYDNALATERSSQAAIQAAKAAVEAARINLGYATVRAPIDGRAGKQQVTEGALVGQGTATLLTTVDQIDPLYVNFSMSVSELSRARGLQSNGKAPQVRVELPDGTVYDHPGVLDFSGDIVDPDTGSVALRAQLPNPDKRLLPGTFVSFDISLGQIPNAFLVPQAAVQRDASSAYVLVVGDDGNVARKDIDADRAQGSDWIVTKGLAGGERIIVSGLQKAQPGQPAKAEPYQPPGAAGGPAGAQPAADAPGDKPAGKPADEAPAGDAPQKD